jgi:hypothetical protein
MKTIQERLEYSKSRTKEWGDRVAGLERQLAAEQAKEAAKQAQGIEVGAIVSNCFGRGVVEATEEGVFAAIVRNTDGLGRFTADALTAIFPANHPVAQSLAARKEGEFYEGDVVELTADFAVNAFRGKNVVLGEHRTKDFWCFDKRFLSSDLPINYGWNREVFGDSAVRLVTPRELRADIGNAEGGEWERWFPQKPSTTTVPAYEPNVGDYVELDWRGRSIGVVEEITSDGEVTLRLAENRRLTAQVSELRPWTPQVGDEVAVLARTCALDREILDRDEVFLVENLRDDDRDILIRRKREKYYALGHYVKPGDIIPWNLRQPAQEPKPPQTFRDRVADDILARLDAQTAKGVAEYGMTLDENKTWDCANGALDELIDAIQYVKCEIERRDARDAVVREVIDLLKIPIDRDGLYLDALVVGELVERLRSTLTVTDASTKGVAA